MKRAGLCAALATGLVLFFSLAGYAQAEELKPWWHLTATTRPAYLQPGGAKDAVYRLTVDATAGTYGLHYNGAGEFLELKGEAENAGLTVGETPTEVQAALETVVGAGNVEVTGSAGPNNSYETYEIKFVGELAFRSNQLAVLDEQQSLSGANRHVTMHLVSEGRPDGYVVVDATNVGDAPADAREHPITLTDVLPKGLEAIGIEGAANESLQNANRESSQLACDRMSVSCTFTGFNPGFGRGNPSSVPPFYRLEMRIAVNFKPGAQAVPFAVEDEASVSGGGAAPVSTERALTASSAPVGFGASSYEVRPEEAGGALDTQAGSHPFQLTTTLQLNDEANGQPAGLAKDLHFKLPPGLIGNPTPLPRCPLAEFYKPVGEEGCPADTAVGAVLSTIRVNAGAGVFYFPFHDAVYNLETSVGEPARFGYNVAGGGTSVILNTAVRTGSDYGVTINVLNIGESAEFTTSELTLWGVPGEASHDDARGESCISQGKQYAYYGGQPPLCASPEESDPRPLLSMPTTCATNPSTGAPEPLHTFVEGDSWQTRPLDTQETQEPQNPFGPLANTAPMGALAGCDETLPRFDPKIIVKPDLQEASKPSGLLVDVHVPQEGQLNPEGIAESNVKNIQVTLPAGVTLNPSAADGLEACSGNPGAQAQSPGNQVGFTGDRELETVPGVTTATFSPHLPGSTDALEAGETAPLQPGVNFCPNASKIGEATIKTPLLPEKQPVKGFVYLAAPQNFAGFPQENPFAKHVAMYIVAEDPVSGSLVKLPGKVELGGEPGVEGLAPGQIRSTFEDTPQLAFEDAELHFFGGERAPLATPSRCGSYTTNAVFTPWAAEPSDEAQVKVSSSSTFNITSGPNGSPCPGASLPSSPSLASGTTNNNAGGFSNLTTTLSREDGQQNIQSVTLHYPAGLSGLLSGVELCPEAQANAGTCGPNSQIGETIVSVGLGGDPFTVTGGKVYVTEKYDGAPFGLSIVNPAKAGPFDLQQGRPVVVRAKIEVDPITAALTITTDPSGEHAIPNIIEGFPLQIKHVNVLINRPEFTFNPTNCNKTEITGQISSAEGASIPVSVPFQATNCASLKFEPKFSVASKAAKNTRLDGATLIAKLSYPSAPQGTYANIARVRVELPKALPSRLTTLRKACTAAQFNTNPAGCPSASKIGFAVVHTPILPVPLSGPAIFVSHGGEAFPSLTIVLQGDGVTVDVVGTTFISKAGVTSTAFKTVPDTPFSTFELTLPQGEFSALTALGNLCKQKLVMPTEFVAHNGAEIHEGTKVSVTGCPWKARKAPKGKGRRGRHGARRKVAGAR